MKVDLGQCAVCGAKNSKYVEKCYKCGAALPWAPDYVAPKNTPQPAKPQSAQTQPAKPVAPDNAKTVVVTPVDAAPNPVVAPQVKTEPDAKERAQSKVAVPTWALGVGGLGLVALGMALWALLGPKHAATPPVVVAPTTAATSPALAPIVPAASATPAANSTPTIGATPAATPLAQPSAAPTNAAVASATTAPAAQTQATIVPAVAPANGPTFDELYANLTTGTPQQQTLYWDSVKGQKINWRGEFVSLGNAAKGPLLVNCKAAKGALQVTVELQEAAPQTLPQLKPNQSVPFSGVLQARAAGQITVGEGRAG